MKIFQGRRGSGCGVGCVVLALLAGAVLNGCGTGQAGPGVAAAPALTAERREHYVQSFDKVWETIRDKHFDPALGGLDWAGVRDELRPRVVAARTAVEARGAMQEMLERLKQTHFGIIPGEAYEAVAESGSAAKGESGGGGGIGGPGRTGITLRVIDGEALVTAVRGSSPAESAGVRPGEIISAVDGKALKPVIETVAKTYADSTLLEAMMTRAAESRLTGEIGGERRLTMVDGEGRRVTRVVGLAEPPGNASTFGNLPTMNVLFESRRIAGVGGGGDVGVIALNIFLDPGSVMPELGRAVEGFSDCAGMVIDLRGNPGGIGAMAMGIGGWFITTPNQKLGQLQTRGTTIRFVLNPRPRAFTGPVAVLIDGGSLSTSEILAGGLQDLGRARVFGTRSGGAALPSVIERLPSGDGFQYAFANYTSVGGNVLEGRGVIPDQVVEPDRTSLLAGGDPVLDAAVAWIRGKSEGAAGAGELRGQPGG